MRGLDDERELGKATLKDVSKVEVKGVQDAFKALVEQLEKAYPARSCDECYVGNCSHDCHSEHYDEELDEGEEHH